MHTYLAFLLSCLNSPLASLECGPFWLVVAFVSFGVAATVVLLIIQSYREWNRTQTLRARHARRAVEKESDQRADLEFENEIGKDIDHRSDNKRR